MVKEAKFFRKQADKAETAARAASDAKVSDGLRAMAVAYRSQAALIKKRQKGKPKKTALKNSRPAKKNAKRNRRV